jgi:hypothetical protein
MPSAFSKFATPLLVTALTLVCCSGIWSVSYFFNQDGTAHLYNSYLLVELLKGNPHIAEFASLNPDPVPNLTGHWLLALLLPVFGPAAATKVMVTLTFGLFVGSIVWLRTQVAGPDFRGSVLAALFGCVLAFNWMWFQGFYNSALAASAFAFTLGLWWRWRAEMTAVRALCIAILLALTFLSHLVSFGLLICSIFFLLLLNTRSIPRMSIVWTFISAAATGPLVLNFLVKGRESGGSFNPRWAFLADSFSPANVVNQIIGADPFALISRKTFPFVESSSPAFITFAPMLWLVIAFVIVAIGALRWRSREPDYSGRAGRHGWILLAIILIGVWLFGPDDFGKTHGGFLRERTLVLGLATLVGCIDVLQLEKRFFYGASACLLLVLAFQTAAVWEYAGRSNVLATPFHEASNALADNEPLGSIIVMDDAPRFRSQPLANLTPILGIGKNAPVWDNYELGYYLFPVIANSTETRAFVYDFREVNTFDLRNPAEDFAVKRSKLADLIDREHERFRVLLVWNEKVELVAIREKWFEPEPFFQSGELKLYRHR